MGSENDINKKLRSMAEAQVKKMPDTKLDLTMDKARTLMHELEVHQVELEMQNQELREAQHLLEDARDQYTDLFDFAPIGYLILDDKGVIENINLTACTMMGIDRSLIKGKPFSAYMSSGESGTLFLKLREAFEHGTLKPFELQIKRNGTDVFTALIHGTVTENGTGKPICRLSMQDVTEIREAEALQQQHEDLQEEKERIARYLNLAPVIFLLLDNEYRVQLINQKGCDLLGYEKHALQGEKWFEYVMPTKNKTENDDIPHFFKYKKMLSLPYFESEVRSKAGERRLIGWTNTVLKDKFGKTIGTLSAGEDITERKRLEAIKEKYTANLEETVKERTKELSEALEAEKKINELKSAFINIASHELRTPITIILSSIILIEKYSEKAEYHKQPRLIERVKKASKQFTAILDDFLSLEKLERGDLRIKKENLNIKEFLRPLLDDMEGILKPQQQIIHTHTGRAEIFQDRKILHHIVSNLLSNAIKYSDSAVELHTAVANGNLIIKIKDSGIGIPKEDQKFLFQRFFRAKNVEHLQGTGLGLSIVERYLDLLEGTIDFSSTVGQGSTFTLTIPSV
ncbi:sensor histidine kinase [Maribacter aestuarii]|uniref:sensor histidine kinase n=1 Tax=Maribacter aestuarii TaxID=1130723 RepID=UPI00248A901C|nr:PAS domain-containing sensor histidine kinase [Maribacter aestuarii]